MNEKLMQVKKHIVDHKDVYIAAGVALTFGLVFGAMGTLVFASITSSVPVISQKINQIAWRPENNQMIINLIEKSTPSKPVHLVGTNLFFNSLHEAARETGHSLREISKNVNGHIPDVKGDVFELLQHA